MSAAQNLPETDEENDPRDGIDYGVLKTFSTSPIGFIFGVVLTPLLNGVDTTVAKSLNLVYLVVFGHSRSAAIGTLGISDIPLVFADLLIDVGDTVGKPILTVVVRPFSEAVVGFADWAGPLGLLGAALALVIIVNVFSSALRTAVEIALDFIPGGGAFIN